MSVFLLFLACRNFPLQLLVNYITGAHLIIQSIQVHPEMDLPGEFEQELIENEGDYRLSFQYTIPGDESTTFFHYYRETYLVQIYREQFVIYVQYNEGNDTGIDYASMPTEILDKAKRLIDDRFPRPPD